MTTGLCHRSRAGFLGSTAKEKGFQCGNWEHPLPQCKRSLPALGPAARRAGGSSHSLGRPGIKRGSRILWLRPSRRASPRPGRPPAKAKHPTPPTAGCSVRSLRGHPRPTGPTPGLPGLSAGFPQPSLVQKQQEASPRDSPSSRLCSPPARPPSFWGAPGPQPPGTPSLRPDGARRCPSGTPLHAAPPPGGGRGHRRHSRERRRGGGVRSRGQPHPCSIRWRSGGGGGVVRRCPVGPQRGKLVPRPEPGEALMHGGGGGEGCSEPRRGGGGDSRCCRRCLTCGEPLREVAVRAVNPCAGVQRRAGGRVPPNPLPPNPTPPPAAPGPRSPGRPPASQPRGARRPRRAARRPAWPPAAPPRRIAAAAVGGCGPPRRRRSPARRPAARPRGPAPRSAVRGRRAGGGRRGGAPVRRRRGGRPSPPPPPPPAAGGRPAAAGRGSAASTPPPPAPSPPPLSAGLGRSPVPRDCRSPEMGFPPPPSCGRGPSSAFLAPERDLSSWIPSLCRWGAATGPRPRGSCPHPWVLRESRTSASISPSPSLSLGAMVSPNGPQSLEMVSVPEARTPCNHPGEL